METRMIKTHDFEYTGMTTVVHELCSSFKNDYDKWSFSIIDPVHNSESFSHNHLLVLKHEDSDFQFLISENPLHFHIDMERVFDVLVEDFPSGRYLSEIFSKSQKETIYSNFCKNFSPTEYITNYALEHELSLRPFKNAQQKNVSDFFMKDKQFKYPTIKDV